MKTAPKVGSLEQLGNYERERQRAYRYCPYLQRETFHQFYFLRGFLVCVLGCLDIFWLFPMT